jgi:hypothetical protein
LPGVLTHEVKLGTDIHGNITRLDNALENFPEIISRCESNLVSVKEQMEAAKGEVGRSFPQEKEFREKAARLMELNILLRMDEKDNQVFEAEPDDYDAEPAPRAMVVAR